MKIDRKRMFSLVASLLAIGEGACGGYGTPSTSQPQVVNNPDSFSFQVQSVSYASASYSYSWQNSGQFANVSAAPNITGGDATLTIHDAANLQVFGPTSLKTGFTANTSMKSAPQGTAGMWKIDVSFSGMSGGVSFQLQKG